MSLKSKLAFALVIIAGIVAMYLLDQGSSDGEVQESLPILESKNQSESPELVTRDTSTSITESKEIEQAQSNADTPIESMSAEPIDVQEFREAHGYYASGSSDISQMHPYELYDLKTLEQLAANDDGLAQLVLADRVFVDDPERADRLYLDAAVNGKTAALVNLASSRLVVVPGGTGWGFPLSTSTGEISQEYVDVLKFYVAAEASGDVLASSMLQDHIDAINPKITNSSLKLLCEAGAEVSDLIKAKQREKWGRLGRVDAPITSYEAPKAVCAN